MKEIKSIWKQYLSCNKPFPGPLFFKSSALNTSIYTMFYFLEYCVKLWENENLLIMSEYYAIPQQWIQLSYRAKCYSTLRSISWWIFSSQSLRDNIGDRLSSGRLRDVNVKTKLFVLSICVIITLLPQKPVLTPQNRLRDIVSYVFGYGTCSQTIYKEAV